MTVTLIASGCRSELFDQEYGEPLEQSNFYADKRMSRPLVEGTVPTNNWEDHRDHLRENDLMYTGLNESGKHADIFPMEVTEQVMLRGRERYNIFCSPCHGLTGQGDGMIIQRSKGGRGLKTPPSFTDARLVSSPAGYFFDVITNGFGQMYSYASRVKPADRWAIVAYIRALQKSQDGMGGWRPAGVWRAWAGRGGVRGRAFRGPWRDASRRGARADVGGAALMDCRLGAAGRVAGFDALGGLRSVSKWLCMLFSLDLSSVSV